MWSNKITGEPQKGRRQDVEDYYRLEREKRKDKKRKKGESR